MLSNKERAFLLDRTRTRVAVDTQCTEGTRKWRCSTRFEESGAIN